MAITILCSECGKKISVDEAFTGSMCRCPYCKAIVSVPESPADAPPTGSRPAVPQRRPDRPDARAAKPATSARPPRAEPVDETVAEDMQRAEDHHPHHPRSTPRRSSVRTPGLFALIAVGLAVVLLGVLAWVLIAHLSGGPVDGNAAAGSVSGSGGDPNRSPGRSEVNPFAPGGSKIIAGDISIRPPVTYIVDAGGAMRSTIGYAAAMLYRSVASLPEKARCRLLVMKDVSSGGLVDPLDDTVNGGKESADQMWAALETTYPAGTTDAVIPEAMKAALEQNAATVVLFTRGPVRGAQAVAAMKSFAEGSGKLVMISVGSHPMDARQLEDAAGRAGAVFRSYTETQLRTMRDETPIR